MSIQYRKILELHAQKVVQRNIAAATGNSRPKIAEIIKRAKEEVLVPPFTDEMDDECSKRYFSRIKSVSLKADNCQILNISIRN